MTRPLNPCKNCGAERLFTDKGHNLLCMVCFEASHTDPNIVGRPVPNKERNEEMVALRIAGLTLEAIGAKYGMTRERVRQLTKRAGVGRKESGRGKVMAAKALARKAQALASRDARTFEAWGCSFAVARMLNDGQHFYTPGSPALRYRNQRATAACREIEWKLTFPEWFSVWQESGHFFQRGRGGHLYVMARIGDVGPYAIGNVYITTCGQNAADYQAELKKRGVMCADGWRRLPEKAHKTDGKPPRTGPGQARGWVFNKRCTSRPYQVTCCQKYIGAFATQAEAEAAYAAAWQEKYDLKKTA